MECINNANALFALHNPMRRDLHYHYVMLGRSHGALQCIIMQFVLGVGIDTPGWLGCCLLHQLHGQLNLNFTRSLKGEKGKAQCIPSCMYCISSRPSQSLGAILLVGWRTKGNARSGPPRNADRQLWSGECVNWCSEQVRVVGNLWFVL